MIWRIRRIPYYRAFCPKCKALFEFDLQGTECIFDEENKITDQYFRCPNCVFTKIPKSDWDLHFHEIDEQIKE